MKKTGELIRMMIALTGMMLLALSAYAQTCTTLCDENDEITYDEVMDAPTVYSSDIAKTYNTVWNNRNFRILGNLVIDNIFIIMNNCKIRMSEGNSITLASGNQLIANGTEFWACDDMWQGIDMESGSIIRFNGSRIEDAQYAIRARYPQSVGVEDSDFNRNNVGIFITDNTVPTSSSTKSSAMSVVGTKFRCCSGLNDSYDGQQPSPGEISYAGIIVDDMAQVFIGSEESDKNEFDSLMNGIIAHESIVTVVNSAFSDITYDDGQAPTSAPFPIKNGGGIWVQYSRLFQQGFGSAANDDFSFSGCDRFSIAGTRSHVEVEENHLIDYGLRGIDLAQHLVPGCIIRNNRFSEEEEAPYSSSTHTQIHFIQGSSGIDEVDSNYIDMAHFTGVSIAMLDWYNNTGSTHINDNTIMHAGNGLYARLNGGNDIYIDDNTISLDSGITAIILSGLSGENIFVRSNVADSDEDTWRGLLINGVEGAVYCLNRFYDSQFGADFYGTCDFSDFKENRFDDHDYGLRINYRSVMGEQEHKENEWFGSYSQWAAQNENDVRVFLEDSRFIVNDDEGSGGSSSFVPNSSGTTSIDPSTGWFITERGTIEDPCDTLAMSIDSADSHLNNISDFDLFVIKDSFLLMTEDTVGNWNHEFYLFKKMTLNSDLQDSHSAFYDTLKTKNVSKFLDAELKYEGAYGIPEDSLEEMNDREYSIDSLVTRIQLYTDSLISDDLNTTAIQAMNKLVISVDSLKSIQSELYAYYEGLAQTELNTADSLNNLITPSGFHEENEKFINSCIIHYMRDTFTAFSDSIENKIVDIANGCPGKHGRSLHKARWLLGSHDSVSTLIDYSCDTAGLQAIQVPLEFFNDLLTKEVVVYPNPAIDLMRIELPQVTYVERVVFFDNMGRIYNTIQIEDEILYSELNVSELVPGTYYGHIVGAEGIITPFRVVIIR